MAFSAMAELQLLPHLRHAASSGRPFWLQWWQWDPLWTYSPGAKADDKEDLLVVCELECPGLANGGFY